MICTICGWDNDPLACMGQCRHALGEPEIDMTDYSVGERLDSPGIPLPFGWRRLRFGEKMTAGDRHYAYGGDSTDANVWIDTIKVHSTYEGFVINRDIRPVIRRVF